MTTETTVITHSQEPSLTPQMLGPEAWQGEAWAGPPRKNSVPGPPGGGRWGRGGPAVGPAQEGVRLTHLFDRVQHGPPAVPWLGGLADAVEAGHAVPLPVLQLPVEGVGQHQHAVVQVEVGDLEDKAGTPSPRCVSTEGEPVEAGGPGCHPASGTQALCCDPLAPRFTLTTQAGWTD